MKIGLTYDLKSVYLAAGFSEEAVAEFDSEETIQALTEAITRLGHTPVRIGNLFALAKQLCSRQQWDLVFNLAEGLHGRSREAQVPALLDAYQIPYTFSDPLTLALALDKAMCKGLVRNAGVKTPDFFVLDDPADAPACLQRLDLGFPLFAKPNAEGTGKGIFCGSKLHTVEELQQRCAQLIAEFHQPVLVEAFLPGREYTVGILGTGPKARVVGVLEIRFLSTAEADVYTYLNKKEYIHRVDYALVCDPVITAAASALALTAYRALGCRDAGRIDIREDTNGELQFLEINPLAGLHPVHSDLPILAQKVGMSYDHLIGAIIESAQSRLPRDVLQPSSALPTPGHRG